MCMISGTAEKTNSEGKLSGWMLDLLYQYCVEEKPRKRKDEGDDDVLWRRYDTVSQNRSDSRALVFCYTCHCLRLYVYPLFEHGES